MEATVVRVAESRFGRRFVRPCFGHGHLSEREQEVLELMAEGRSNRGIAAALHLTERTVESHNRSIFLKLDIAAEPEGHRRVLAVLAFLRQSA